MNGRRPSFYRRWPTGIILLLLLTAALLPLGLVLGWAAHQSVQDAENAHVARADEQSRTAAQAIESLIARNALALRIAANGAMASRAADPCGAARRSLAIAPAVGLHFRLRDPSGRALCSVGQFLPEREGMLVAPGAIRLWVSPQKLVHYRTGLVDGAATGVLNGDELRQVALSGTSGLRQLVITDGQTELNVIDSPAPSGGGARLRVRSYAISGGQLQVRTATMIERTQLFDQVVMMMPVLMWIVATLLSWIVVRRLLLRPLARLQRAVSEVQPGETAFELPDHLGPTAEIRDLSTAFERAVNRVEGAELEAVEALEGQRRLVREVHHRVKNNLQVVASLLSIHGRSATKPEAKNAYSAIGRRVDALSVVHRNHYAEMEESRGIALRPLLTELAAGLRSSAPSEARAMTIELDLDSPSTTQDVAVAAAFLITEIVEFAMLRHPKDPIEISLRRINELTATLAISASILVPDGEPGDVAKDQFERIVEGLARQLRSPLERKLGRYAVTLPVFPDN